MQGIIRPPDKDRKEVERLQRTVELQASRCDTLRHTIYHRVKTHAGRPSVLLTLFAAGFCTGLIKRKLSGAHHTIHRSSTHNSTLNSTQRIHALAQPQSNTPPGYVGGSASVSDLINTGRSIVSLLREADMMLRSRNRNTSHTTTVDNPSDYSGTQSRD
jgi:hypothetical protein